MAPSTVVKLFALLKSAMAITLPPLPALCAAASALMMPLCWMVSLASRRTVPPSRVRPVASSVPVLRTTPPCKRSAACADRMIRPPGARTALPFSTSAWMVAGVTSRLASVWLPLNCNSYASPAASATVPSCATMTPRLRTSGASSAMYPPSAAVICPSLTMLPVAPLRVKR
ncbi:hypothetical protein [Cupriavidus sp. PET2-C1]